MGDAVAPVQKGKNQILSNNAQKRKLQKLHKVYKFLASFKFRTHPASARLFVCLRIYVVFMVNILQISSTKLQKEIWKLLKQGHAYSAHPSLRHKLSFCKEKISAAPPPYCRAHENLVLLFFLPFLE